MKKQLQIALLMLIAVITLSRCSGVKKLPATVAGASRARFVGIWKLNNISYDGLLPGSVQMLFDQGPPDSFNGSTWNLTNSGNGIYTLNNGTSQTLFWSYDGGNGGTFQFKKLYQGDRAKNVQEGYKLMVTSNDSNNMILKLPVSLGDKTAFVVLNFNKTR